MMESMMKTAVVCSKETEIGEVALEFKKEIE